MVTRMAFPDRNPASRPMARAIDPSHKLARVTSRKPAPVEVWEARPRGDDPSHNLTTIASQ